MVFIIIVNSLEKFEISSLSDREVIAVWMDVIGY